jgi:hypothetical protein
MSATGEKCHRLTGQANVPLPPTMSKHPQFAEGALVCTQEKLSPTSGRAGEAVEALSACAQAAVAAAANSTTTTPFLLHMTVSFTQP